MDVLVSVVDGISTRIGQSSAPTASRVAAVNAVLIGVWDKY